jgi:chromosome segregation ATPase
MQRKWKDTELQLAGKDSEIAVVREQYQAQIQDLRTTMETLRQALAEREKTVQEKERALHKELQRQQSQRLFRATTGEKRRSSSPVSAHAAAMANTMAHASPITLPDPQAAELAFQKHRLEVQLAEMQDTVHALRQNVATLEGMQTVWKSENESLRSMLRDVGQPTPSPVPMPEVTYVQDNRSDHQALLKDLEVASFRIRELQRALTDSQDEAGHAKQRQRIAEDQVRHLESEIQSLRLQLATAIASASMATPAISRSPVPPVVLSASPAPAQPIYVQTDNSSALRELEQHILSKLQTLQSRLQSNDGPFQQILESIQQLQQRTDSFARENSSWDDLLHRWQDWSQEENGHWNSFNDSVERLVERIEALKQENKELQKQSESWRSHATEREQELLQLRAQVEGSFQEWQQQQATLLSCLENYEKQVRYMVNLC